MKIKPNYLYRVLGDLEKEGRVTKDGRKYSATK
jgi:DNA-binding PadR family transcriptional regulator